MDSKKGLMRAIPRTIRIFLLKSLIVFIAWQAIYQFWLRPTRLIDRPLTNITAILTAKVVGLFYNSARLAMLNAFKVILVVDDKKAIGIADPCNALEIFVLYTGFIFCYPAHNKRRWLFMLIGVPSIFIMNIIRCALLCWVNVRHRAWMDITHHYIFTSIMYLFIFYLWILFSKSGKEYVP